MNQPFRIEEKEAFRIIGKRISTTNKKHQGKQDIAMLWDDFHKHQEQDIILPMMTQKPYGILGISVYNTVEDDAYLFDYYIGVSSDQQAMDGFESYLVPAATWAVFPCTLATMGKTQVQAIMKWLPKFHYQPCNTGYIRGKMNSSAPDIEWYGQDENVEIWVAVTKK